MKDVAPNVQSIQTVCQISPVFDRNAKIPVPERAVKTPNAWLLITCPGVHVSLDLQETHTVIALPRHQLVSHQKINKARALLIHWTEQKPRITNICHQHIIIIIIIMTVELEHINKLPLLPAPALNTWKSSAKFLYLDEQ